MSDVLDERASPTDSPDVSQGTQMARWTIHVPVRDNDKNEIPHVLDSARRALGDAGFQGRTVIRRAQGDWQGDDQNYAVEEMDLIMVDAPDAQESEDAILGVAQLVKAMADQEAVYVTKQDVTTYLV
jgi:hypothetical protein